MSLQPEMLILGATGGQGGAVTNALLHRGVRVRALVRDPTSARSSALAAAGVQLIRGSLTNVDSLRSAMDGVAAAFALTTPFEAGPEVEIAQGMTIIAGALQSRLPFLVYSSVAGALQHSAVPHFDSKAEIEDELRTRGLPHTVLAPTYFYDNLYPQILGMADGVISLPLPSDRWLQQLDRDTYGQIAAEVLQNPGRWIGQRIEVAADEPTGREMAAALERAAHRPVRYRPVPLADMRTADPDMAAMWRFLDTHGYQVDIPALQALFPHVTWTSFSQWADSVFHRGLAPAPA